MCYTSTFLIQLICISVPAPAFNKIGGYSNLESVYLKAVPSKIIPNTTCHLPRPDAMHLFRDPVHGDLPWPGMTLGLTILATWYWCTDQVRVNTLIQIVTCQPSTQESDVKNSIKSIPCIASCIA